MKQSSKYFLSIFLTLVFLSITFYILKISYEKSSKDENLKKNDVNNFIQNAEPKKITFNNACITKTEQKIVQGNSLSGLIEHNSTVTILFGYYNCNKIMRNDIVVFNFSGNKELIIKVINGIPGDKFTLVKNDSFWNIIINGNLLKNSKNIYYQLDERGYRMLSLYEKDYKGIIPDNAYLLLGNLPTGSLDSTRFGLIDKSGILGKVILT